MINGKKYLLFLSAENCMVFYVKECAEIYLSAYGGNLIEITEEEIYKQSQKNSSTGK